MRILSHEVFSVSHGGHGNKAKNEDEGRTKASTVVTVGGGGPGLLMRGQRAREQGKRGSCSCYSALASRLWQPGLAQEVIFRMKWRMPGGMEGGRVGEPRSQSGLQGRVQDVVMVAVAVGVAVIALGAGVVGRLLQPHQHVHLWGEQRGWSTCQLAGKPTWPLWSPCHLLQTHPGGQGSPERQTRALSPASLLPSYMTLKGYLVLSCGISLLLKLNSIVPLRHVEIWDELIYVPHCE